MLLAHLPSDQALQRHPDLLADAALWWRCAELAGEAKVVPLAALTTRLPASTTDCLCLHRWLADATALASIQAAGTTCVIWTVNAPDAMDRYLRHPAVEMAITDRPALALERRRI